MDINVVKRDIEQWLTNFVEVPHPALGGWPPCPYARSARLKNSYSVLIGTDPVTDLKSRSQCGMQNQEVYVYVYDPNWVSHSELSRSINLANQQWLLPCDMIALEDHPDDPEVINGVSMNQGTWALALVQSLSELNAKASSLGQRGFYQSWPESYLRELFQHRKDPRP